MTDVAVVGMGPWGLAVLERLVTASLRGLDAVGITAHVVEPSLPGPGVFGGDQPDYLILNTPCGEHSMYPFADQAAGRRGMGFYEWAVATGYQWVGERCERTTTGRPLGPHDFLPRRLMGEYLSWFYRCLLEEAPPSLRVVHHETAAVDITERGTRERVLLANGAVLEVDHVVLTTGHTPNERSLPEFLLPPYPVTALDRLVAPGSSVAVRGMGLVAVDVVTALTIGRGGTFVRRNGGLQYLPSGQEPRISLFSRSGYPYCAKSLGAADTTGGYRPVILTPEAVAMLRHRGTLGATGGVGIWGAEAHDGREDPGDPGGAGRRIDARRDLLPLVLAEMTACYYHECVKADIGPEAGRAVSDALAAAWRTGTYRAALAQLVERFGTFDAAGLLFAWEDETFVSGKDYQARVAEMLETDVSAARVPNGASPRKRAQEVLRALRDTLRLALEFGGLTAASHRDFQEHLRNPLARLVAGPPVHRAEQLLALMDAEVVRMPFGPSPVVLAGKRGAVIVSRMLDRPHAERVDHVVVGHLDEPTVNRSASPLLRRLHDRGRIRQLRVDGEEVGSIDLTDDFHPRGAQGIEQRLWIFGALSEGVRYYTAYLPSPSSRVRAFLDAGRCVDQILGSLP